MAEFCIDCWNKLHGTNYTKNDVRTDMDLCEGCGQWKPVIVVLRPPGLWGRLQDLYAYLEALVTERRYRKRN